MKPIIIFIIFSFLKTCSSMDLNLNPQWSSYQGYLNWDDAKIKCASIQRRLPTRAELNAAVKSGITESWKSDWKNPSAPFYWTSEEKSKSQAYFIVLNLIGSETSGTKGNIMHIRCIH